MTTENVLTNEQIARVFALYQGQEVLCFPSDDMDYRWLPPTMLKWNVIAGTHYGVTNTILALTPLSAISDEDAIEVAKTVWSKNEEWKVERYGSHIYYLDVVCYKTMNGHTPSRKVNIYWLGKEIKVFTHDDDEVIPNAVDTFLAWQYLIQKGYDLPLFIEPGHPFNGKTAIELGLAIDKSTIK